VAAMAWAALGPRPADISGQQGTTTDNSTATQPACPLAANRLRLAYNDEVTPKLPRPVRG
jgi:hypothetical protein